MNQNIKTETWCGYDIRFVEKDGHWWAILKDVCDALGLKTFEVSRQLKELYFEAENKSYEDNMGSTHKMYSDDKKSKEDDLNEILVQTLDGESILTKIPFADALGRLRPTLIVAELGLYDVIFQSRKKEAKEFKQWTYKILRELRSQAGLESYEAFRMTDKEIQKQATDRLYKITHPESNIPVIKANTIANYATSKKHHLPKTIKKGSMTKEMLVDRQAIYNDTVNLMIAQQAFDLDISISEKVYAKYLKED